MLIEKRQSAAVGASLTLEAPRLVLESFRPQDAEVVRKWLGTSRVSRGFLSRPGDQNQPNADDILRQYDGRSSILLIVRERDTFCPLGFFTLGTAPGSRCLWISMAIGERSGLGRGFAEEAGLAVANWAFSTKRFDRIEAIAAENNRLIAHALKLCMHDEGIVQGRLEPDPNGMPISLRRYGLNRDQWPSKSKAVTESLASRNL
jgi:RimJ/RimL family protein N-acetyltransferase